MAKFLSFAVGWKKDDGKIGCSGGGNNCSLFDPSTKQSEKMDLKLKLVNSSGEEMDVTNFYVKETEGGTSKNGKPLPTHQFIVVLED